MSIPLITRDYETEVSKERLPVVVEFFASWCPKCSMMEDVVERLARKMRRTVIFKKVDIDFSEELAHELGVEIVPTFVVYLYGEIIGYTSGVLSEGTLENRILEMLEEAGV
ncbi:MAG: thioredoxin family protein [Coprococcus sp.]|nr:thioredoxin family protein [Coprococcus sp.]